MNPDHKRIETIVNRVPDTVSNILDVGCVRHDAERRQRGNLHDRLVTSNPQADVLGIDVAEDEIRQMQRQGYNVLSKDAESFEFDRTFDVIVAGELIEHLPNPGLFLTQAEKHLTEDGLIIISTPNPNHVRYTLFALAGKWTSDEHTCWISPHQLHTLCERATTDLSVRDITWMPPLRRYQPLYRVYNRMASPTYIAELTNES